MGNSLSFSLSRSRTAQKYAADDNGNADGAVASSQSASLADTRLLVPSTARNEQATSTSLMGAVEGNASSGGRGTRDLATCASLPVSVPSPSSRFRRAQSDSQQEIGQLNELEESVSPSHSQASLPAHIEKCLTGIVACPSNALSRKAGQCLREVVNYCKTRRPEIFELDRPPLRLLALALSQMGLPGLRVSIRKVAHCSKVYWSSPNGSEFIVCVASDGPKATQTTIVDPSFKDNFKTPHATERYSRVLDLIPGCFIGSPSSLLPLLRLLVFELTLTFKAHNADLPPWRTVNALSSRWLSDACSDEAISATAFLRAASKSATQQVQAAFDNDQGASRSPLRPQHSSWSQSELEAMHSNACPDSPSQLLSTTSFSAISAPSVCSDDRSSTDLQAHLTIGFNIKQTHDH